MRPLLAKTQLCGVPEARREKVEGDGEQALQVDQRGFEPSELCLHLKKEKRPFYDPNFCLATLILNDFRHTPCHSGSNRVLSRAASESPRWPTLQTEHMEESPGKPVNHSHT